MLELSSPLEPGMSSERGADFLVLSGKPLNEPVVASGPWIATSTRELEKAYASYNAGKMGFPWDHNLTDEEWLLRCKQWQQAHRHPPKADSL